MKKQNKEEKLKEELDITVDTETTNKDSQEEEELKESVNSSEESDLNAQLEEANEKCTELNDKNLRLMAEFDNFRKRTLKEKAELIKSGGENVLKEMLPLVDDFERAIQSMKNSKDVEAVKEGLDLIYNKFLKFLNDNSVKEIEVIGEKFDDEIHEAVSLFPTEDKDQKGKIIDCMEKGYTLNDKVIRFPKVIVGE
ncbi:MAG: nucleotide exchange factor GrpE [Paludibacter sp.]|nr:MAG: nucleotide exchange factor GrpE [Paludibacter sp.]